MANEWYRWPEADLKAAQAALSYINSNDNLPLIGVNAKTGQPQPTKQKTIIWAEDVTVCIDGKVGFPRVPKNILEHIGISESEQELFLSTFNPTIEEFDPSWLPVAEEED